MNAEELMIGNLVTIESDYYKELKGLPFKVTGISERPPHPEIPDEKYSITLERVDGKIVFIDTVISAWSFWLRPIPITAEWLERFGFQRSNTKEYIERFGFSSSNDPNEWYLQVKHQNGLTKFICVNIRTKNLQYVHELQNHFTVNHKIKLQIK